MLRGDIEEKEGHLQLAVANERISQPLACGDVLLFVCNSLHAVPPAARKTSSSLTIVNHLPAPSGILLPLRKKQNKTHEF